MNQQCIKQVLSVINNEKRVKNSDDYAGNVYRKPSDTILSPKYLHMSPWGLSDIFEYYDCRIKSLWLWGFFDVKSKENYFYCEWI